MCISGNVAIFGGTGHVGREIIAELAGERPDLTLHVFARASGQDPGQRRAENAARWALGGSIGAAALQFHEADLAVPGLGLSPEAREALIGCDHVIDAAADVQFGHPLEVARERNVQTVLNLLDRLDGAKPFFHYVSTAYVAQGAGTAAPRPVDLDGTFRNTYERTKAEAEAVVMASGLPWRIYRPSIVVGSSRDGRATSYDTVYNFARALLRGRLPVVPAGAERLLDIVPSDFVAHSIRRLAEDGEPNTIHHVTADRRASPVRELLESFTTTLRELEHPRAEACSAGGLRHLDSEWFERLLGLDPRHAPATLRQTAEVIRLYLPFTRADVPRFDASSTLAVTGIESPSFAEYGGDIWRYAIAHDFGRTSAGRRSRSSLPATAAGHLADLVRHSATRSPHAPALSWDGHELTYAELVARVDEARDRLAAMGVGAGTRLGLRVGRSGHDLVLLVAATDLSAELHLLPQVDELPSTAPDLTVVRADDDSPRIVFEGTAEPGSPGVLMATSGTTGPPKWIRHRHDALPACGWAAASRLQVRSDHRVALFLPLHHAYASGIVIPAAWTSGACVELVDHRPGGLLESVAVSGATHVVGVMDHFQDLLDETAEGAVADLDLSRWEVALCGDDPLLPAVWEAFERTFCRPLAQGYGLSEALLVAVGVTPAPAGVGMVVQPLPGVTVRIVDEEGAEVADGVIGHIRVEAPWQMRSPDATESPVATGDLGWRTQAGLLHVIGRDLPQAHAAETSSPAGRGTSAMEITDALLRDPRVSRAHTLWIEGRPVAFVVPRAGHESELPLVFEVGDTAVHLQIRSHLPRTPVGKVNRASLVADASRVVIPQSVT